MNRGFELPSYAATRRQSGIPKGFELEACRIARLMRDQYSLGFVDIGGRDTHVVVSEFGRTLLQNGNRGTEHGHGSVMCVLGGAVHGGAVVGEQLKISSSTLFHNRDYAVMNEYRRVLGGIFKRLWGMSDSQLKIVFPGYADAKDWGLV